MRNFRVVRVDAITGQAVLLHDFVTENYAWRISTRLEELESKKATRYSWFVVTNMDDWKRLAKQFLDYRKDLILS